MCIGARYIIVTRVGMRPEQLIFGHYGVRTCREELTNHIIPLGENHLLGLLNEYVEYYNKDRRHMSLNKSPPIHRERQSRKEGQKLVALPRVGGLHHKYEWQSGQSTLHFDSHGGSLRRDAA